MVFFFICSSIPAAVIKSQIATRVAAAECLCCVEQPCDLTAREPGSACSGLSEELRQPGGTRPPLERKPCPKLHYNEVHFLFRWCRRRRVVNSEKKTVSQWKKKQKKNIWGRETNKQNKSFLFFQPRSIQQSEFTVGAGGLVCVKWYKITKLEQLHWAFSRKAASKQDK